MANCRQTAIAWEMPNLFPWGYSKTSLFYNQHKGITITELQNIHVNFCFSFKS